MQRIVTNLQAVVKARGLSLPPQLQPPAGLEAGQGDGASGGSKDGSSAGADEADDGGSIAGGGSGGSLPLSVLLGGNLVDRMDLLGRTGGPRLFVVTMRP